MFKKRLKIGFLFIAALGLAAFLGGCKKPEAGKAPEALTREVLEIARRLTEEQDSSSLEKAMDLEAFRATVIERNYFPKEPPKEEFREIFLKGMRLMFQKGRAGLGVEFRTRNFCQTAEACDVLLYDHADDLGGSINLVFKYEKRGDEWKIVYCSFFTYGRWAITASRGARADFRRKMFANFPE